MKPSLKWYVFKVVLLAGLVAGLGATAVAYASDDTSPPSSEQIAFAQRTSDLMLNELLAALLQEFSETSPANVEEGKQAISLVFNDANRDMRLVGVLAPLLGGKNDRPSDSFERAALDLALTGQPYTAIQRVGDRWYYRRSFALSNFHPSCVMCHTNFGPVNPHQWVGALMLRVPINTDTDE